MSKPKSQPPQHQDRQPGLQSEMRPPPQGEARKYRASSKLQGKTAIITGGDSGIGRATAIAFAKEGADIAIVYLDEHVDADRTKALVEKEGARCLLMAGDIGDENFCRDVITKAVKSFSHIDILVNNAAEQHPQDRIENITGDQLERTFRTNIFSMFYLTKAAMPHLRPGASIVNCASVTAYRGNRQLLDYSATKGAVVAFTRSLSQSLAGQNIRVNAVAPGPDLDSAHSFHVRRGACGPPLGGPASRTKSHHASSFSHPRIRPT